MAGLLGYAVAGGMAGLGQGMVQQAQARREEFLENLRHERRQAERMQDRAWQVEDRDLALSRRGGGGGGGGAARTVSLSSGMQSRLERRFRDPVSGQIDWDNVDMVSGEMERLMREEGLPETDAFRMATDRAVFETTTTQPGMVGRLLGREPTTRQGTRIEGFGAPSGAQPAAQGASSAPGLVPPPAEVLNGAREAIRQGADRNAVIERLRQNGYSAQGL